MTITLADECENCGGYEERTFRDSWTGMDLCIECLAPIIKNISMSPGTDGDNLKELLDQESADHATPAYLTIADINR